MVSETAIPPCSCNRYDYFARSYFVGVVVRWWWWTSIYQWWESRNPSRELHHIRFCFFHVWFGCAATQYEFDANCSIADLLEGGLEEKVASFSLHNQSQNNAGSISPSPTKTGAKRIRIKQRRGETLSAGTEYR
jgi:hypothetical protein